ncbi:MAG: PadR family transcriptional regulator [Eubacteriaceae bacterium]|nr:PadR family transcriptional regulator [Eubacteriaceae bacterium]
MLELMVLACLMTSPCHGYELKRLLSGFNPNNNKIYPLLRKMEKNGYVTFREEAVEGRPSRKVYSVTEAGRRRLVEILSDFGGPAASDDEEFYLRVAFFQFLDKPRIGEILRKREEALRSYTSDSGVMTGVDRIPDTAYDIRFLKNYVDSRISEEIRFINALREKYGIDK